MWMTSGHEAVLLGDLPEHVVSKVFMLLPGEALATLAVQNRQLRRFMATQSLWRNCCCCRQDLSIPLTPPLIEGRAIGCRWPYMETFCPKTELEWRLMYRDRHSLPSTFWSKAGLLMQTARQSFGQNAASVETWQVCQIP